MIHPFLCIVNSFRLPDNRSKLECHTDAESNIIQQKNK